MNYPRIYSLSTVGILKHYVQDYLFHSTRTDFIGPNGAGKSIIADLLQLMFVYESEHIRFGTDGLQQDKRSIYSLPYKTKIAYCFLNIEIAKGEFIIIGILINSIKGKRIIPFTITNNEDLNSSKEQHILNSNEVLFAKDFLKNNVIPEIVDLAREIFQSKHLYLNSFKNKEEVQYYYRFLFDKNILPINLSIDKNFNAFSKVIQSFSRAKTLNLNGNQASKSLKEFLFEESDEDLLKDYQSQQTALEKILKEYHRLNTYIKLLEQKQQQLLKLRENESKYLFSFNDFKKAELNTAYQNLQLSQDKYIEHVELLSKEKEKCERLKSILTKLPRIDKLIFDASENAIKNYDLHSEYKKLCDSRDNLKNDISYLRSIKLPDIHNDWQIIVDAIEKDNFDKVETKLLIDFATPLLEKYSTFQKIEKTRESQNSYIEELKAKLTTDKRQKEKICNILSNETKESLMHWFRSHRCQLSEDQSHALLHFATTPINKINNPENKSRFVDPLKLFDDFQVIPDTNKKGFWIRLGAINEFISFDPDGYLFGRNENLDQSVQKIISKLNKEIYSIDEKLNELDKINKLQSYNKSLFEQDFDLSLVEYSNIKKLKTAVACILQFEEKISLLEFEKNNLDESISTFKYQLISANKISDDPEVIRLELDKIRKLMTNRVKVFSTYSGEKKQENLAVDKIIIDNENKSRELNDNLTILQTEFQKLNTSYYNKFQEEYTEFNAIVEGLDKFEAKYKEDFDNYKEYYNIVTYQFDETSNYKNTAVKYEIDKKTYSFRVLEEALLGTKIKSTDDIYKALHEANQERLMISDGIRDNMVKVFENTLTRYKKYKEQIQSINTFFKGRQISGRFYFKLKFVENKIIDIAFIEEMIKQVRQAASHGELPFNQSIDEFIEDLFKNLARIKNKVPIDKLLNPKTYFDLSVSLTDQNENEIPGSTGETYSAISLLGIARLSVVQKEQRAGLRFIILEEIGSLDNTNFNTFPVIADEFNYQIITMAVHPFNLGLTDNWYAHHLIKGKEDENINFHPSASYFKTKGDSENLEVYLNKLKNELD